ncbi:unnamed protein product [Darwinula stevensoni]|uniref:Homologous-pairing protein 2 homolog n=1 Tax=Darwinula stevensoni TaxID=69355 RepID=A0A7R9AGD0_9CRUS|nr:unnamed protein product [Darwinula stevensoni]CAG0904094.1 unnamed protein product [Darwinula stevensoni]
MSKTTEKQLRETVLEYMCQQNRPYNISDISQNLHLEQGKAALQKALDHLVQDNKLKEKTYNKQRIYVVNQDILKDLGKGDVGGIDAKISGLDSEYKASLEDLKKYEVELKAIHKVISISEAKKQLLEVKEAIGKMKENLAAMENKSSTVTAPVVSEKKEDLKADREKCEREWQKRKRLCLDVLGAILENYPKSKKELFEEIGIETDEDAGVSLPK